MNGNPGPSIRTVRTITAILVVMFLVFAGYSVYAYLPKAADGIEIDGADGGVKGEVNFRVASGREVDWELDGEPLATNTSTVPWDSTTVANGRHEVRAGNLVREFDVQNPRRDAETTATVVGTSTALVIGGSAVGSSVASQVAVAAAQVGKESLLALGEDHLALRTASRRKRMPSRIALAITLLMVFLFFAFEGLERLAWRDYIDTLPLVGTVAATFVALGLGVEALLAYAGRAKSQIRFLFTGAASLVISSIVFRTPFGFPGYVHEEDDADGDGEADWPPKVEAWRALASILVLFAILAPFLLVPIAGVSEVALEIAIISAATAALPIKPMPGYDVWKWNRLLAVALVLGMYTMYFGFQLGFLPYSIFPSMAWAGIIVYGGTFAYLRGFTARTTPPWLLALRHVRKSLASASIFAPERLVRQWAALRGWAARAAASMDGIGNAVHRRAMAMLQPFTRWAARNESQRAQTRIDDAERRFIADAQAFLRGMDDLDDDLVITTSSAEIHLGTMRADLLRTILKRAQ